jgi:branched-chain amino acid transport system substrate-binding protein
MIFRAMTRWYSLACVFVVLQSNVQAQTHGVYPDKVVLQHVGPLSNAVLAATNKEALDGADLYLKLVNDNGGVRGRRIVIERNDDEQDPKKTAAIAASIAEKKSGIAFVLSRTSPSIDAMIPIAESNGIALVGPQVGPSSVTEPPKRTVFSVRASYAQEVIRAIELQHLLGRRNFAVVAATDSFGTDVLKHMTEPISRLDVKLLATERIDNRAPDVTQAVANILKLKPEVILLVCGSKCGADFVRGYAKGGGIAQYVALSNSSNTAFVRELGDLKQGVVVMQVTPSPFAPKYPVARQYRAASETAKLPVTYSGFLGFLTAKLCVEAIKRSGKTPTSESFIAAMASFRSLDLGGISFTYGSSDRRGSTFVEATIIGKDGRFVY